jgi:hypothetical protein
MTKISKKRAAVLGAVAGATLMVSGVAAAYWTTTGSGTGTAGVGTDTQVTVTQQGSVTGLVPGGPSQSVDIRLKNTAAGPETVSAVHISISSISGATGLGCTASDFSLTDPTLSATSIAANGTLDVSGSIAMVDQSWDQNGCKGATVNLAFDVS